jgi:hypothetical protein
MKLQTRVELAQSSSGIGACVLGIGIGMLFQNFLQFSSSIFLVTGIVLHSWGMITLAKMKDESGRKMFYTNHWIRLGMWICVVLILLLTVYLFRT